MQNQTTTGIRPDILTQSGKYFDFIHPEKNEFTIVDIAHALSHICRFAGHTREFYCVAQHSVLVSQIVEPQYCLAALLHDAAEAFIGDVTRPLKTLLPGYKEIEVRVEEAIFARFGLPAKLPQAVKDADNILLATEQRDLMPEHDDEWVAIAGVPCLQREIIPWSASQSKLFFLRRFEAIVGRAELAHG